MLFNNCCDNIYKSFDVHFTNVCNNKCAYCIDKHTERPDCSEIPDWKSIANTIIKYKESINDVLILGGEPFLFIDELNSLVEEIKGNSKLEVFITTSLPKTCANNIDKFEKILSRIDGLNISAHNCSQTRAESVLGTEYGYDRNYFIYNMPFKNKIRICLNLVKGVLDDPKDIVENVKFFKDFSSIKLSELQQAPSYYVSFEKLFDTKFPSPYSNSCQTDVSDMFNFVTDNKVILKRSCFLVENSLKASWKDGVKLLHKKIFKRKDRVFGVVFENGELHRGWT